MPLARGTLGVGTRAGNGVAVAQQGPPSVACKVLHPLFARFSIRCLQGPLCYLVGFEGVPSDGG